MLTAELPDCREADAKAGAGPSSASGAAAAHSTQRGRGSNRGHTSRSGAVSPPQPAGRRMVTRAAAKRKAKGAEDEEEEDVIIVGEELAAAAAADAKGWSCPQCTYANTALLEACEMCGGMRPGGSAGSKGKGAAAVGRP